MGCGSLLLVVIIVPAMDITLPLKIAFMGRSFLTVALRAWIGLGATLRDPPEVLLGLREISLFEPNLNLGGAMTRSCNRCAVRRNLIQDSTSFSEGG
jgi:hypothetical protein